ncbi:MAG: GNAT family N-acetyltransferase [Desulfatibacillaceae bacterium]
MKPIADSRSCGLELAGYRPGVIGEITATHARYYAEHWNFDLSFESQVATELSAFLRAFVENRDCFLTAWLYGAFAGSVAVDGAVDDPDGPRLRWFIVPPQYQGRGVGRILLNRAMDFCRDRYDRMHLWTFSGLDCARHLYESAGFRVAEEHQVAQWGNNILEQKCMTRLR